MQVDNQEAMVDTPEVVSLEHLKYYAECLATCSLLQVDICKHKGCTSCLYRSFVDWE